MKYSLMMCIGALLVAVCVFSTPAWAEPEQGACIFGTQNVWISPGIVVESSLGSNNYVEVGAYSVIMGDITSGGNASLLDYAIVDDDAVVAGSLYKANGADVLGEEEEGAGVPPVVIPTKTVSFGGTNVTVDTQHGCDQIVSPGTYNDITVATGCRLTMESGIYHMRKLYLDTYTELVVEGEVEINTARAFNFGDWSIITGVEDPADLIIYTNQNWQVRIGTDTLFSGYLYTPKTVANVAPRASFNGCIRARDVLIDPDAIFIGDEEEVTVTDEWSVEPPFEGTKFKYMEKRFGGGVVATTNRGDVVGVDAAGTLTVLFDSRSADKPHGILDLSGHTYSIIADNQLSLYSTSQPGAFRLAPIGLKCPRTARCPLSGCVIK